MGAVISPCGQYRYELHRYVPCVPRWVRPCTFIMLNPSTADAEKDDPTIRRCIGFAKSWACSDLFVVNLFAYRATKPSDMYGAADQIGPGNDAYIRFNLRGTGPIVCAWGAVRKKFERRAADVLNLIRSQGLEALHLGLTSGGHPRHPLYVPAATEPRSMWPQVPPTPTCACPTPGEGVARGDCEWATSHGVLGPCPCVCHRRGAGGAE